MTSDGTSVDDFHGREVRILKIRVRVDIPQFLQERCEGS